MLFTVPCILVLNLVCTEALLLQASTSEPKITLPINVFNLANVPEQTVLLAQRTAAWIFRQASIELHWVDCSSSDSDDTRLHNCDGSATSFTVTMKLLPKEITRRFELPPSKFAFALRPKQVFIFFDRVQEATEDTGFSGLVC